MIKKITLAALGGAITGMLMATLIFMGIFGSTAEQWMQDNAACLHEMSWTGGVLGGIVQATFVAILLYKLNISTFKSGAVAGAWISFFMVLWYGLWNVSTFNAYTWDWLPLDVIGNTVTGAVAGGVVGWILGKVK